ncbi:hypothetical protein [Mycobacteroides abscessus]|uniref:hypothetical protein n=1 Tax=Mycobacteroides abscessus TaxID=36809 RepID=UPI0021020339|nr:hypothetical protein [Mycobacteroides abscessus]
MAGKKRSAAGRDIAEKAFMDTYAAQRQTIGDIGEAYEEYRLSLAAAEEKRAAYEAKRSGAVKANTFNNSQLDQLGYKKTVKLNIPTLPGEDDAADTAQPAAKTTKSTKKQTETADSAADGTDLGGSHIDPDSDNTPAEHDAERSPAYVS